MFKLLKIVAIATVGMMFAPKKGIELRSDFVDYLKKYKPQIQNFISALELAIEKSRNEENDEVAANIQLKLDHIKEVGEQLDGAKTKEIAFKSLIKVNNIAVGITKELVKSENAKIIAKDLAKISVSILDSASENYKKAKSLSASYSDKLVVESDSFEKEKENKIKVVKIKQTEE